MKTQALYLEDSYLKEMEAKILEVQPEGNSWKVILDKTVFYPMGGGQPTDQGKLTGENWKADVFQVLTRDGEIWHSLKSFTPNEAPNVRGEVGPTPPIAGAEVHGTINWDRRFKNMRLHSAGHVVDFAMYLLGYSPKSLIPLKGDHGKKPHIMYQGKINEDIKQKLEAKSNELVAKNLKFTTIFQPFADLKKEAIYLQPGLPTDKPLRTLRLETVGAVADGGTQVATTAQVGKIFITQIDTLGETLVVHYALAQ